MIYIYIYRERDIDIKTLLQKDTHRFTDHFASPEMSVRDDFEG